MDKKPIAIATITARMNRILDAFCITDENKNQAEATTSSKAISSSSYSTQTGLEAHKDILAYAANIPKNVIRTIGEEVPISHRTRSSRSIKRGNCENTISACNIKRKMAKRKMSSTNVPKTGIKNDTASKKQSRRCVKNTDTDGETENDNGQSTDPQ